MDQLKKYCITNSLNDLSKIDKETASFMLKKVPDVLAKYPDNKNIYHKKALQILEIFEEPPPVGSEEFCTTLKGLKNTGQSCYLDSVLFSLFAVPNEFVDYNILYTDLQYETGGSNGFFSCAPQANVNNKEEMQTSRELDFSNRQKVQHDLIQIAESIRGKKHVEYCVDLRATLRNCPTPDNFSETGMKDPAEFLIYILKLFNVDKSVRVQTVYSTNYIGNIYDLEFYPENPLFTVEKFSIKENENIVQFIDKTYLSNLENKIYYISKFLTSVDAVIEGSPKTTIYTKSLYSSPYVIFYVERTSFSTRDYNALIKGDDINLERLRIQLIKTKIIPTMTITLNDGSRFQLSSIVIYQSYHYTCYFKCGINWYYYDDLKSKIITVGSYKKMINSKPSPVTNGILYFYVKMEMPTIKNLNFNLF
jgi:hypothetical protein